MGGGLLTGEAVFPLPLSCWLEGRRDSRVGDATGDHEETFGMKACRLEPPGRRNQVLDLMERAPGPSECGLVCEREGHPF